MIITTKNFAPTGVKLDPKLKLRLKKLAEFKQRTIHWLIKCAIEKYVAEEEQAERLRKETLLRWQEIEQGKTISNQAVMSWLDTWGAKTEAKKPTCGK